VPRDVEAVRALTALQEIFVRLYNAGDLDGLVETGVIALFLSGQKIRTVYYTRDYGPSEMAQTAEGRRKDGSTKINR
jgi:hypothetical protein